ncbi:hypothetical protein C2S52_013644 [Perilla frutescens var. hirtella]|nr:hypothetical protein C2S52_013644 [Perilla frutescens var. hirtella]
MRFFSSLKMKLIASCFAANAKADISDMKMASQLVRKSSEIGVESFIEQIEQIEEQIEIFSNLLVKLKEASEESKSVTKTSSMTAIRKQMEKDANEVVKIARSVKVKIEAIDKDNLANREKRGCGKGTAIDRLRTNMT